MSRVVSDIGRFCLVPEWVLKHRNLTPTAKTVYGILALYADRDKEAHPKRKTLAADLGVSYDTIDRALKELTAVGALSVQRRTSDVGDFTSNLYILRFTPQSETHRGSRTDAATPPSRTDAEGSRTDAATGSRTDAPTPPANFGSNVLPHQELQTENANGSRSNAELEDQDQDQDQRASRATLTHPRPPDENPKLLTKFAAEAWRQVQGGRLPAGDLSEAVKVSAARAGIRYDGDRVRKAIDSAEVIISRRDGVDPAPPLPPPKAVRGFTAVGEISRGEAERLCAEIARRAVPGAA